MKNLHVLPTDKPSRLWTNNLRRRLELDEFPERHPTNIAKHIYITSDQEPKEGDWVVENHTFKRQPYIGKCFYPKNDGTVTDEILKRDLLSVKYEGHYETLALKHNCKKITLTTDQDLIKDSVQAIDDEFLEWFVKNPSCERVEIETFEVEDYVGFAGHTGYPTFHNEYKIIIPKEEPEQSVEEYTQQGLEKYFEEPEQETLEEAAEKYSQELLEAKTIQPHEKTWIKSMFIYIANWQAERMYSEEEVQVKLYECLGHFAQKYNIIINGNEIDEWFNQFKKK
jgi:hypothetical protein